MKNDNRDIVSDPIEKLTITMADFNSITPAKTPGFIHFTSKKIGNGTIGGYSPEEGIKIFYASFTPDKNYVWQSEKIEPADKIFFNYILEAPKGMRASIDDEVARETLSNRTLLVDATHSDYKTIRLIGNERFEIFQIEITETKFLEILESLSPKLFSREQTLDFNHFYRQERMGFLAPFDVVEERCIREIINFPMNSELQNPFTSLKIFELMIWHFQKVLNNEISSQAENGKISLEERDKIAAIKNHIDEHINERLDVEFLSKEYELSVAQIKSIFVKIFGCSVVHYYKNQKLNAAYTMLVDVQKELTVKEIAYFLDFNSTASFSRAFYNKFNVRPSDISLKIKDLNFNFSG